MKKILFVSQLFLILFICVSTYSQTKQTAFNVKNTSGLSISSVSITNSGGDDWRVINGSKKSLANNDIFTFIMELDPSSCSYDIQYNANDGNTYRMDNVSLCGSTEISLVKTTKFTKTK